MIRVQNWQKRLNAIIKSIEQVLDHWQNKLENLDFWFAQPNGRYQKFVSFLLQWCLLCTNEWSFMQQSLELGQSSIELWQIDYYSYNLYRGVQCTVMCAWGERDYYFQQTFLSFMSNWIRYFYQGDAFLSFWLHHDVVDLI